MKIERKINIAIVIVMLCICFVLVRLANKKVNKENERLKNNITALTKRMHEYVLKDSTQKVEIEQLTYKNEEMYFINDALNNYIDILDIKRKNVKEITQISTRANYVIDTFFVKDTIIITEKQTDTLTKTHYKDAYVDLSVSQKDNKITKADIITFDTITTIVHKEYRKRFLCFKWRPYYKVTIHNTNPYSRITNAQNVKIE